MILALDTTLDACSVALAEGGEIVAEKSEARSRGHAEALIPMIDDLVASAGRRMDEIRSIVVTTGPGTFTGVRIGIAAARGLALALKVPVVGVPTLDALAVSAVAGGAASSADTPGTPILTAIDARRGDLYLALFQATESDFPVEPIIPAARIATDNVKSWLGRWNREIGPDTKRVFVLGSGARILVKLIPEIQAGNAPDTPDIATLACLASNLPTAYQENLPAPLYLRPPDALPPRAGALRPRPAK